MTNTVVRRIPLRDGYEALVDEQDFALVSPYNWYLHPISKTRSTNYVIRTFWDPEVKKTRTQTMHRLILNVMDRKLDVDHINHNGLDNRRCNIRICSRAENHHNRRKSKGKSSSFKGVSFDQDRGLWHTQITVNKKTINLGRFEDEHEAALAYDDAVLAYRNRFAKLNFELPTSEVASK